jgi:hypothetical protein
MMSSLLSSSSSSLCTSLSPDQLAHPIASHDFDHLNVPGHPSAISAFDEQQKEEKNDNNTIISDPEDINNDEDDNHNDLKDNDNIQHKATVMITPCNSEISVDPDLLMDTSYYQALGLSLVLYPLYLRIEQLQREIEDQSIIVNDAAQIQSLQQQLVEFEQTYKHDGIWNGNLKLGIIPAGQAQLNNLYERTHEICNEIIQRVDKSKTISTNSVHPIQC